MAWSYSSIKTATLLNFSNKASTKVHKAALGLTKDSVSEIL